MVRWHRRKVVEGDPIASVIAIIPATEYLPISFCCLGYTNPNVLMVIMFGRWLRAAECHPNSTERVYTSCCVYLWCLCEGLLGYRKQSREKECLLFRTVWDKQNAHCPAP